MHAPRFLPLLPVLLLSAGLSACGGSSGGGGAIPLSPAAVFWVDAQAGDDNHPGTQALPFKTLTHATTAAGPGTTLQVLPGLYDSVHGEVFPIELQAGQQVLGDIANRGLGGVTTTVAGEGPTSYGNEGTVLMAQGSSLQGFELRGATNPSFHHSVHIRQVAATVQHNTFGGPTYGGVFVDDPLGATILDNDFHTSSYGVYVDVMPGAFTISANAFDTPQIPVQVLSSSSGCVIEGNQFTASSQTGVSVWGGDPLITANLFDNPGGYTYGAIYTGSASSTPVVRGNTFICKLAVRVNAGAPDLGTALDPGGNDLTAVTITCLQHDGPAALSAIGNTWPNTPPTNNGDIQISNGGTVTWGSGPSDQY